jgi:hypothetical protein
MVIKLRGENSICSTHEETRDVYGNLIGKSPKKITLWRLNVDDKVLKWISDK